MKIRAFLLSFLLSVALAFDFRPDSCQDDPGRFISRRGACNSPHQYSSLGLKEEYFEAVASLPKRGFYPVDSYMFLARLNQSMNISAQAELMGFAKFDFEECHTQVTLCHTLGTFFPEIGDTDFDVVSLVERISREVNYQKYQLRLLSLSYLSIYDDIFALWLFSPTDKNLIFLLDNAFNLPRGVELDFDRVQVVWSAYENVIHKAWPRDPATDLHYPF
jgi:hypothetical protein